jgi:hypothetical protein
VEERGEWMMKEGCRQPWMSRVEEDRGGRGGDGAGSRAASYE